MLRNLYLAVCAVGVIITCAIGFSPTSFADSGVTAEALLHSKTDRDTAQAYADLANEMLVNAGMPPVPLHVAMNPTDVDRNAILVGWVPDMLHNPDYGSRFSLAFRVGEAVRVSVAGMRQEQYADGTIFLLRQACYGGAMMRAFGQVTGLSPRPDIDMQKVNELIRQQFGNEPAKPMLVARDTGLANGPAACDAPVSSV